MITTSGITNPIRDIAGNWMTGISSIRFISTMKKNIDAMYPRYLSPFLPSCGRTIWSRTARMAISPRLCVLPGISFGFANATQKNTITMSAHKIAITSGFVTCHAPIMNHVWKLKSCSPGAGNPHPLKMWQPPLAIAEAATSPVTGKSPLGGLPSGGASGGPLQRACSSCVTGGRTYRRPSRVIGRPRPPCRSG